MATAAGWSDIGNNLFRNDANGQVVDSYHPIYQAALNAAPAAPAPPAAAAPGSTYTPPNAAPGTPTPNAAQQQANITTQGANSQTYSATPTGATTAYNTNQGTQDTVRNSYLAQASAPVNTDVNNDPVLRAQADNYAAAQTRAARNAMGDAAEQLGPYATGALQGQKRLAVEHAGQNSANFEAMLMQKDLERQRSEKADALQHLGGMISQDQENALRRELAQLDATLKTQGVNAQTSLGEQDLALKNKLGMGGLSVDLMRALLQNQQFGQDLGLRIDQFGHNAMMDSIFGR